MKVNGIIAEYNPFHNGHKYNLDQVKKETGADYTIIVLSGNFTQRGEPALIDKFVRARMAMENGADLVVELPISHAASSAEYFARGGVSILNKMNVVDFLCFGSECGDAKVLTEIAEILLEEPEKFSKDLRSAQRAGLSYPAARNRALVNYRPALAQNEAVMTSPNNILGIEYIKALLQMKSRIQPITIRRAGSDYHDRRFGSNFCSALALRQAILSGQELESLTSQMPASAYELLKKTLAKTPAVCTDDFSNMLLYKLLSEQEMSYDRYLDVSSDLSDRIHNNLKKFSGYSKFCNLLKTKNMTYTRISRCLLHIMLDMKDEEKLSYGTLGEVPYARVLGFRREAQPLLTQIKERTEIPLITKLADATNLLSPQAYALLAQDLRRGSMYESVAAMKSGRAAKDEKEMPIVIV